VAEPPKRKVRRRRSFGCVSAWRLSQKRLGAFLTLLADVGIEQEQQPAEEDETRGACLQEEGERGDQSRALSVKTANEYLAAAKGFTR